MWFLNLEAVRSFQSEEGPEEDELSYLRQQLCLPRDEDIHLRPVVLVVYFASHYFVVVVDYEEDVMYVFGRHVAQELAGVYLQDEEDWREWQGDLLWIHLPRLFAWEGCSPMPNVILSINWFQVGACYVPCQCWC